MPVVALVVVAENTPIAAITCPSATMDIATPAPNAIIATMASMGLVAQCARRDMRACHAATVVRVVTVVVVVLVVVLVGLQHMVVAWAEVLVVVLVDLQHMVVAVLVDLHNMAEVLEANTERLLNDLRISCGE